VESAVKRDVFGSGQPLPAREIENPGRVDILGGREVEAVERFELGEAGGFGHRRTFGLCSRSMKVVSAVHVERLPRAAA
jgi:hypothetical protein